jgi:hypothetical protein
MNKIEPHEKKNNFIILSTEENDDIAKIRLQGHHVIPLKFKQDFHAQSQLTRVGNKKPTQKTHPKTHPKKPQKYHLKNPLKCFLFVFFCFFKFLIFYGN